MLWRMGYNFSCPGIEIWLCNIPGPGLKFDGTMLLYPGIEIPGYKSPEPTALRND